LKNQFSLSRRVCDCPGGITLCAEIDVLYVGIIVSDVADRPRDRTPHSRACCMGSRECRVVLGVTV
jgi:hypothetical protein